MRIIETNPIVEIEQQRQAQNHEDLEMYRRLGILETFTFQGEDDEDVELQMLRAMGCSENEVLYAVEAGAALKELNERNEKAHKCP